MYLTYEEYQNMGGTLDDTAFTDLEYEARAYINWITFDRLKKETTIPEEVKECEYHILKLMQARLDAMRIPQGDNEASASGAGIASQSNDGVSVSYNILTARELIKTLEAEIKIVGNRYLQGVKDSLGHRLLYRGLYPDE